MDYVDKSDLKNLYMQCIEQQELTNEFTTVATNIAKVRIKQKGYDEQMDIYQDANYNFILRLVRGWQKIDQDKNILSYLCGMVSYALADAKRKYYKKHSNIDDAALIAYADQCDYYDEYHIDAYDF